MEELTKKSFKKIVSAGDYLSMYKSKNETIVYNHYDLKLFSKGGSVYVSAKEVSGILSKGEKLHPFCGFAPQNIIVTKNGNSVDILIDIMILNQSILKTSGLLKKRTPKKTYLMFDKNTGFVKIGRSKNPKIRESVIQSEKPTITLFAVCEYNIEAVLHRAYKSKRVRGEWFQLTKTEINFIIQEYSFKKV